LFDNTRPNYHTLFLLALTWNDGDPNSQTITVQRILNQNGTFGLPKSADHDAGACAYR